MNPKTRTVEEIIQLGATKVALSLSMTFYFKLSFYAERNGVIACMDDYLARCGTNLRWYSDTVVSGFLPATTERLQHPSQRLRDEGLSREHFAWITFGSEHHRGVSPFLFEASSETAPAHLSYLRATFPIEWFVDDFGAFAALARSWANRLHIYHGYGGLAFNESAVRSVWQSDSRLVFALSKRFTGIEVDNPYLTRRSGFEAIKGVNWLTLISEGFVAQLGGAEALRARLSPAILLDEIPAGLMIQAGAEPGLGDVNADDTLPAYREVAQALKPIRVKKHFPLGPEEFGSFGWEGTDAWLRRFD